MNTSSSQGSTRRTSRRSQQGAAAPRKTSSQDEPASRLLTSPGSNRDRADRDRTASSLFSSSPPRGIRSQADVVASSEVAMDISSPLPYGNLTPSSRIDGTPGGRGTPSRRRVDIRSTAGTPRQFNVAAPSETEEAGSERGAGSEPHLVVWGTDVVVEVCQTKFRSFLLDFMDPDVAEDEEFESLDRCQPLYLQKLREIAHCKDHTLDFNLSFLKKFDKELYRQLVSYPQEVIPTFDVAANELFFELHPDVTLEQQIQVRPYNADKTRDMRDLDPKDIDQLITVSGMVIRLSNLIPEMREAFFKCCVCHTSVTVELDRGRITEPTLCQHCNTNHSFTLIHNRSQFTDKQMVKLQESPEDSPAGETPHMIIMYVHNDLVDAVCPGDRVTVTGVYRASPQRVNPRQRNIQSVYRVHVDVVHFRKLDESRLRQTATNPKLSEEQIERLKELSMKSDIYERLANAIAPSIYEHEDIKKGILLQLLGGTKKDFSHVGRGEFRAEMNILLCGDPGTSKSQLLQFVHRLVPKGQYTSGKGSSAVGLTAYVTKDPDTKQLVLQTGALALSDNGVCCIDEFDKMNDSTRSVLHEVMEQQTMSIAKAGIICQLNARTSILAAANPVDSQWNKNKTIIENVQLPHTMLSRFDLIFLMLDPQDQTYDRRLANHLVALYHSEETAEEGLNPATLRDYIAYAKMNSPDITTDAAQSLVDEYIQMRLLGSRRGQVSAYPRQLNSLIRLAAAHAKMRMSKEVTTDDVKEARRLQMEALKQAAVDPSTGRIDVSILATGISGAARKKKADMARALNTFMVEKNRPTFTSSALYEDFKTRSDVMIPRDSFEDALRGLADDGIIVVTNKVVRLIR